MSTIWGGWSQLRGENEETHFVILCPPVGVQGGGMLIAGQMPVHGEGIWEDGGHGRKACYSLFVFYSNYRPSGFAHLRLSSRPVCAQRISCHDTGSSGDPAQR